MSSSTTIQAGQGRAGYDRVAITLHWLVAALVTLQFLTKLIDPKSIGATEDGINAWHLAIGPTILLLMLIRLAWRLTHPAPPPPADLAAPLRLLARATHWAFYALLIVIPVLGWVSASGWGARPMLLGFIPLPMIAPQSKSLAESWGGVHGTLAWALLAIIALHLCGAIYHATVKHDGVVTRMLSPLKPRGAPNSH